MLYAAYYPRKHEILPGTKRFHISFSMQIISWMTLTVSVVTHIIDAKPILGIWDTNNEHSQIKSYSNEHQKSTPMHNVRSDFNGDKSADKKQDLYPSRHTFSPFRSSRRKSACTVASFSEQPPQTFLPVNVGGSISESNMVAESDAVNLENDTPMERNRWLISNRPASGVHSAV